MHAHKKMLPVPLLISTLLLKIASGDHSVWVSDSSCPGCVTLVECLNNINNCFTTNTRVYFTDRSYKIQNFSSSFYIVSNARNLALSGNGSMLECATRSVGFTFINVTNLQIHGLHFNGCGETIPDYVLSQLHLSNTGSSAFFMSKGTRAALLLGNIDQLILQRTDVHNSYGYGVLIVDSTWIEINQCNFSHNNRRALECYQGNDGTANMSCCHSLIESEEACIGGNIVIINTDDGLHAMNTRTHILNTWITNGINLDTQQSFKENYTYTAGGLSLFSDHPKYNESVLISNCNIASNIGHNGGNVVVYIHDNIGSEYSLRITKTSFLNGNVGFERFEKTAKSGGLTIMYGYVDEHLRLPGVGHIYTKSIAIQHSTFRGNKAFTAGAILFQSHIFRDKTMRARINVINCTVSNNFGYDTIFTVRGNLGNRFYKLKLEMYGIRMLNNRLLGRVSLIDPLLAYHFTPHISALHTEEFDTATCAGIEIRGNELRGLSTRLNTQFRFQGENFISDNRGTEGGALHIDNSIIRLQHSSTRLHITNNTATLSGGAIYITPSPPRLISSSSFCFFDIKYTQCDAIPHQLRGSILLRNNSAGVSGNGIYGGNIETCTLYECFATSLDIHLTGISIFELVFDIPWNRSLTEVTSDVEQLCFCVHGRPQCSLESWSVSGYPGVQVHVPTVAVGQLNGTTPGIVLSTIVGSDSAQITEQEMRQQVGVECHNLNYTVRSLERVEFEIKLGIVTNGRVLKTDQTIFVNMSECPIGFVLKSRKCSCIPLLEDHKITCFLEEQNFRRPEKVWVGFDPQMEEFLAHSNCPLQKCNSSRSNFSLTSTDTNCKRGFSGILCGRCADNFSATLGRIGCRQCHPTLSALAVSMFIIAGPLLIVGMLYGDLTVNHGTFNGIIFYANVVHIHRFTIFGQDHTSVLIAWLNLDLGIQLCFYPGMTFYAQQWLQYLFPAYILFLLVVLNLLNWYTTLGGKIIGNNIRNVNGTMILLSYTKLLRPVTETLAFTYVSSSQSTPRKVWLYDGNTPYMEAKHAVLVAASLVTLLTFLLPFTFIMLLEYPLLRHKTQRLLVKTGVVSLIQVIQKPYIKSTRWWTGTMLLARVLLATLQQVSASSDQSFSMVIIVTVGLNILGTMWNLGSLYRNKYVTMVEAFYITNLVLLAGWSEYISSYRSQLILSYVLISMAILIFLATIAYHVTCKALVFTKQKRLKNMDTRSSVVQHPDNQAAPPASHTHTYVRVTGDQMPLSTILANIQ